MGLNWIISDRLPKRLKCSPVVRETWVQSQVASYQRLLKWYLIHPCLTLSNIMYGSRLKWSNPGKGVTPSPTLRCSSYWKGSLLVALDCGWQLYLLVIDSNTSKHLMVRRNDSCWICLFVLNSNICWIYLLVLNSNICWIYLLVLNSNICWIYLIVLNSNICCIYLLVLNINI